MIAAQFVPFPVESSDVAPLPQVSHDCCAGCSARDRCLPTGLTGSNIQRLEGIITRRRVFQGDALYRTGDPFTNLYAIHAGYFKTNQVTVDGCEQITGFQMAGELLGMDAFGAASHNCNAVALEDSEVCAIPFDQLEKMFAEMPLLLRHFHRTLSQEIARNQLNMLLLGNMSAEQRFANFLLSLSSRYQARGYSATSFHLRMSRDEISNFLGLTIETVSRMISKFRKMGWIAVDNRDIRLNDLPTLNLLAK